MSSQTENGDAPAAYLIEGEAYPRVPVGAESDEIAPDGGPCPECAAVAGSLHTPGCAQEECPLCQYPVADCDCEIEPA